RSPRLLPAVVALAAVAGFSVYFHVAPPRTVFCTFNVDPEAAYLLTSLAVFKGQPYVYVEHPGLPLALAGSVLLAPARLFFGTGEEFALAVLRHPDAFFVLAHALLVVGTLLSMWSLARWAVPRRHDAQGWLAGGVAASFFAVTPDAFFWPVYWSHNAPALPLGTPLLLAELLASRRPRLP